VCDSSDVMQRPCAIVRTVGLAGKVTLVEMQKPSSFHYDSGQYLFLNIPSIAKFEWHPFTISSAPEDPVITCHIRAAGNWTNQLHKMYGTGLDTSAPLPVAFIDGPYGAATEEVGDTDASALGLRW
jgi:predicted ferric reductase